MEDLILLFRNLIGEEPECIKIKGEGSNRCYYRMVSSSVSLVGVVGESVDENRAFISLSNHFVEKGLNVPQVLAVSSDCMCYLQTDLGNESLFHYLSEGIGSGVFSQKEKMMLHKTIRQLVAIQLKGSEDLDYSVCYPLPEMDKQSVLWDLNYFKYCFLKLTHTDFSEPRLEADFQALADDLLKESTNTFLYRDFQSRNVMVKDDQPYFIDFQGGRRGPVYYDLASFVWQAKANYPKELKEELISVYLDELKKYREVDEVSFRQTLNTFVLFRMIQVLGAYGYRGLFERKEHFLESIPFALGNIEMLLDTVDFSSYPYLCEVLRQLIANKSLQKKSLPDPSKLKVKVYSFSYKKGIPEDESGNGGGYVFDCRGVHNPGRYDEYKSLTGMDKPVKDFLENDGEILEFLRHIYALADMHVLRYMERGFTSLMFSCGCTGGQHRSVYSAQHLAEYISRKYGVEVMLIHREQNVTQHFPCK